jgi:GDPmannose 4,6-dehydratase
MVLGCNGQDGTFLCRRLVRANLGLVIGVGLEHEPRFSYDASRFRYVSLDIGGESADLRALLADTRPQRIFHVAAVHASAQTAQYEPLFESMLSVNVRSLYTVLEHLRTSDPAARFIYASSSKVFGSPLPAIIDENTPRSSPCLYSTAKNAAGDLIRYYRSAHGTRASQLYLFNHESELRPPDFFIPKLVGALRAAGRKERQVQHFHTLDFHCDWGSADEYMGIMIDVLDRAPSDDFVLATGRTVHARTLVERLFEQRGVSMRDYVIEDVKDAGAPDYAVNIGKLKSMGSSPGITIEQLVEQLAASAPLPAAEV